jgi:lipopolysaccharide transport system permease protein
MVKREVVGRYKGSMMGLLWSFLNPVLMLIIYTFVFSVIFKARWGTSEESKTQFAIVLFAGMIVQSLFAEVVNRAPGLMIANTNFVKKVVFPLEILPVITMGAALFHNVISIFVLLAAFLFLNGYLQWTVIFLPLIIFPLIILTQGIAWILASLGVFLRDIAQTVGILTTVLSFLAPVFYPVSALPAGMQPYIKLNPLTVIIEQARAVLVFGKIPDWSELGIYTLISVLIAWFGYAWFQKTRKAFADVI